MGSSNSKDGNADPGGKTICYTIHVTHLNTSKMGEEMSKVKTWIENNSYSSVKEIKSDNAISKKWMQDERQLRVAFKPECQDRPLEEFWNLAKTWCKQQPSKFNCWMIPPNGTQRDNIKEEYTAASVDIGASSGTNQFVPCFRVSKSPAKIATKLQFKSQQILMYMKAKNNHFICLELTDGLFYEQASFYVGKEQTSLFLHLKGRPMVHKLTQSNNTAASLDNMNIHDSNMTWSRTADIGDGGMEYLGKCDVISISFGGTTNLIPLLEVMIGRKWVCRFLQVQYLPSKDLLDANALDYHTKNKTSSFEIMYLVGMLLSRGLKVHAKLAQNEEFVPALLDESIPLHYKSYIEKQLLDLCDNDPLWYTVNFGNVTRDLKKKASYRPKQPNNRHVLVRSAFLTPSQVLLYPEQKMDSSRILRDNEVDCFLRISFKDENREHLSQPDDEFIKAVVAKRIQNGLNVAGEQYLYLGGSNSHLREHGCCLYRKDTRGKTADDLRQTIGDLTNIRCVAKHAARVGLAFSQTQEGLPIANIKTEDDIIGGNGPNNEEYCFSDGIGKISRERISKVQRHLKGPPASAYQIRIGGTKGVVALDPTLAGDQIVLRKSMVKFPSNHTKLDIQNQSKPKRLFMNHQIITLLSQQGVEDMIFYRLQEKQIDRVLWSLFEESKARPQLDRILSKVFPFKVTEYLPCQVTMVSFFRQLLLNLVQQELYVILNKARIMIPEDTGRNMMGVLDETRKLEYGEVFIQYSTDIHSRSNGSKIHKGKVTISKMPCLHPGDVRIFTAIDKQELHHMKDVVFPQWGQRPHPNELSGSDLDGDEYWVCWHPDMMLASNSEAMSYPSIPQKDLPHDVTTDDSIKYLMHYIQNDVTSIIARAHLCHADSQPDGIHSAQCIQLAQLHSRAVDSPKTGEKVVLPDELKSRKYPDFLQKGDHKISYTSERILGKLYRQYKSIYSELSSRNNKEAKQKGTESFANLVPGMNNDEPDEGIKKLVCGVKKDYEDKLRSLMNKYGLETEVDLFMGNLFHSSSAFVRKADKFQLQQELQESLKMICKETQSKLRRSGDQHLIAVACFQFEHPQTFPWLFSDGLRIQRPADQTIQSDQRLYNVGQNVWNILRPEANRMKTLTQILLHLEESMLNLIQKEIWIGIVFFWYEKAMAYSVKHTELFSFILEEAVKLELMQYTAEVRSRSWLDRLKFWENPKEETAKEILRELYDVAKHDPGLDFVRIGRLTTSTLISSLHCPESHCPLADVRPEVLSKSLVKVLKTGIPVTLKDSKHIPSEISISEDSIDTRVFKLTKNATREVEQGIELLRPRLEEVDLDKDKATLSVKGCSSMIDKLDIEVQRLNKEFPDSAPTQQRTGRRGIHNKKQCYKCGEVGHIQRDCRSRRSAHYK